MNTGLIPSYFFCRKRYRDSKKYLSLSVAQYLALHARSIYITSVNTLTAARCSREVTLERGTGRESARTERGSRGRYTCCAGGRDDVTGAAVTARWRTRGKISGGTRAPGEPSRQSGVSSERDLALTVGALFVHRSITITPLPREDSRPEDRVTRNAGRSDVTLAAPVSRSLSHRSLSR